MGHLQKCSRTFLPGLPETNKQKKQKTKNKTCPGYTFGCSGCLVDADPRGRALGCDPDFLPENQEAEQDPQRTWRPHGLCVSRSFGHLSLSWPTVQTPQEPRRPVKAHFLRVFAGDEEPGWGRVRQSWALTPGPAAHGRSRAFDVTRIPLG